MASSPLKAPDGRPAKGANQQRLDADALGKHREWSGRHGQDQACRTEPKVDGSSTGGTRARSRLSVAGETPVDEEGAHNDQRRRDGKSDRHERRRSRRELGERAAVDVRGFALLEASAGREGDDGPPDVQQKPDERRNQPEARATTSST